MLGIIKRSGQCRAIGHFCHVKISVNGRKVWASGAEDRTFYMHLVTWDDIGRCVPKGMIPAVGWAKDGNGYVYRFNNSLVLASGRGSLEPLPEDMYRDEWKDELPPTLIERGAAIPMVNHYIALLEEPTQAKTWGTPRSPEPRVTLPVGCWNPETNEFDELKGAVSIWGGKPPPWCKQVVVVCSPDGWIHVTDEQITTLWRRDEVPMPNDSTEAGG